MKRRDFLGAVGAAAAVAPFGLRSPAANKLGRIGLELYSVRDAMKEAPAATMVTVHEMGYGDVELLWSFDNFGQTAEQVRDSLKKAGLRAPSAHIDPGILRLEWQRRLDTANTLGHQYLIVPSLPADTNRSLDRWRAWADRFNSAGEVARKSGIWLAFHNEPDHQRPIDGQIPYDLFIERLDPRFVRLQLDVGNMLLGGGDPHAYLAAHADRYWSFHLKDVVADRSHDTELGTGVFDFKRFLAAVKDLDEKPCYVEQESAADPMASARRNCGYLRDLRF